jgi:hypothetical protein
MKPYFITALAILALPSCARFTTTQTDVSTLDEKGKPTRTITTKATASTFFEGRSALAKFKAIQTDKSQSASVGELSQETTGTNVSLLAEAIAKGVAAGLNPIK